MNEQMISKAVEEVIREMTSGHEIKGHVCKCKKHKMTLEVAKALIEKVEQKAKEIGLAAVIAVSDEAGRVVPGKERRNKGLYETISECGEHAVRGGT